EGEGGQLAAWSLEVEGGGACPRSRRRGRRGLGVCAGVVSDSGVRRWCAEAVLEKREERRGSRRRKKQGKRRKRKAKKEEDEAEGGG
ncbi:MAG: hypothetical protein K2J03_04270, partial [Muribaculaceae bacterium]|nr:hypothetical protein [Muribaculaceae bacterium]